MYFYYRNVSSCHERLLDLVVICQFCKLSGCLQYLVILVQIFKVKIPNTVVFSNNGALFYKEFVCTLVGFVKHCSKRKRILSL